MLNEWMYLTRRWVFFVSKTLKKSIISRKPLCTGILTHHILTNSALSHCSSLLTEIRVATCQCVLFPRPSSLHVTYENTLYSIFLFNQEEYCTSNQNWACFENEPYLKIIGDRSIFQRSLFQKVFLFQRWLRAEKRNVLCVSNTLEIDEVKILRSLQWTILKRFWWFHHNFHKEYSCWNPQMRFKLIHFNMKSAKYQVCNLCTTHSSVLKFSDMQVHRSSLYRTGFLLCFVCLFLFQTLFLNSRHNVRFLFQKVVIPKSHSKIWNKTRPFGISYGKAIFRNNERSTQWPFRILILFFGINEYLLE